MRGGEGRGRERENLEGQEVRLCQGRCGIITSSGFYAEKALLYFWRLPKKKKKALHSISHAKAAETALQTRY